MTENVTYTTDQAAGFLARTEMLGGASWLADMPGIGWVLEAVELELVQEHEVAAFMRDWWNKKDLTSWITEAVERKKLADEISGESAA